jgi:hypothetical protein
MDGEFEIKEADRLEDFIVLTWQGKEVRLSVELKKPILTPKFRPGEIEGLKGDMDMYLLVANYSFNVEGEIRRVSKIYGAGIVEEPQDFTQKNSFIANKRLEIDYKRLEGSHIKFEKKYWE